MINYEKLAGDSIKSMSPYKPGKPIAELKRELGLQTVIKLASNENPFGPSKNAIKAIEAALPEISRYPLGDAYDIRKLVAEKYEVCEDMLIFGTGSNELIEILMRTFVHNDDFVVSPAPSFPVYGLTASAMGTKCEWVKTKEDFKIDLSEVLKVLYNKKARMVFLANPNNPVGNYINEKELLCFMDKAPKDVIIVMDEAYIEFTEAEDMPDTVSMLKKYKNLVLLRTFSKAYGLAGLRIGYGIADKECIAMMNRVRQPFNTNMLAQVAACEAIKDEEWLKKIISENKKGRDLFYKTFDELHLKYIKSQSNFILVNVKDGAKVFDALLKKGVIVRPQPKELKEYIRVSIGTYEENEIFIKALKEIL